MECPICRQDSPENSKFCNQCAFEMSAAVGDDVGTFNGVRAYTPKHLADTVLKSKSSINGERKSVTVLFADVVKYTAMSEKLDPVDVHQIMDGCFKILINEIHSHKGTINQFTGDGIMALFGAPHAIEEHAQGACSAALAIQKKLKGYHRTLAKDYDINFQMRIGINSGVVVTASIGDDLRKDYTALGDTTNLAARMERAAKPGTVLVSSYTYKKVRQQFDLQAIGKIRVKGKDQRVEAYRLLKGKTYRPRFGMERRIYSELVGRDSELNKLELQLTKAINGYGSVVNIIGEAGIGKSRLVAELKNNNAVKRAVILEGRAISIGRNLSFYPLIDLLKNWAQIGGDDTEISSMSKLETAIKSVTWEDSEEIIPFVATLMGMKLAGRYAERINGIEGEPLERLILKNVRDLLIRAANLTPLVIIMEDLHWADTSSIKLLESLFRLSDSQRILFINVFRPDHKETGDRVVETIKEKIPVYYVEINLGPLSEKMSGKLIDNMLNIKGQHLEIWKQIVQRSGGNPFFIEEVVRSYIDEGAIIAKDGNFKVTDKIESVITPNTIDDVLMARIDRLEDGTRDFVIIASVIGRSFFHRIISEMVSKSNNINAKLSHLKEIQLIRERKRLDEVEYFFKHALAQEVAYKSILPVRRRRLHLKVARTIEKVFSDRISEFFGVLAYHYNIAENIVKAEDYLIKAGEEALKTSASNEAFHYYHEALQLYLKKYGDSADPEKVAMLKKNIALALYHKGQYDEAVDYFDKALNYYWKKLPTNKFSATWMFITAFSSFLLALYFPSLKFKKIPTERDNEIGDLFFRKCEALVVINPKRFFVESFYFQKHVTNFNPEKFKLGVGPFISVSSLFSFTGLSFRLSRKILNLVKPKIDKHNAKHLILYDLLETEHNYCSGNWSAISDHDDKLVERNLSTGEIWFASQHYFWHGLSSIYRGSLTIAESLVNKLNEMFETYENEIALLLKQLLNTCVLVECRKKKEALDEIEKGIDFGQKTNQGLLLLHMFSCHARIHILTGDINEAERSLEQADKIRRTLDTVPWQLSSFRKGKLEYDLFRLNESLQTGFVSNKAERRKQTCRSCRTLLKESRKVAQNCTESYHLAGLYYWLINRQKKALHFWGKAIEEGEKLGARLQLARAYFEIAKRLSEPKSRYGKLKKLTTDECIKRAGSLFKEMNLQWDLNELDRLVNERQA